MTGEPRESQNTLDEVVIEDLPEAENRPLTLAQKRAQGIFAFGLRFFHPEHRRKRLTMLSVALLGCILVIVGSVIWGSANNLPTQGDKEGSYTQETATQQSVDEQSLNVAHFYFMTLPEWGTYQLDGKPLDNIPHLGRGMPLRLPLQESRRLSWDVQPFGSGSCVLHFPLTKSKDECHLLPQSIDNRNSFFVQFPFTLDSLADKDQITLQATIQRLLDSRIKRETLAVGDHYSRDGKTLQAAVPMQLEQQFQLVTQVQEKFVCDGVSLGDKCLLNGFNCLRFCSFPIWPQAADHQDHWTVAALLQTNWNYFSVGGEKLFSVQGREGGKGALRLQYISLDIRYLDQGWQVSFYTGNNSSFDDPYCIDLNGQILNGLEQRNYRTPMAQPYMPGATVAFSWLYESKSENGSGCLAYSRATVTNNEGSHAQIAEELDRNPLKLYSHAGVLMAMDERTRQYWPDLPVASSHEQSLAPQIENTAG